MPLSDNNDSTSLHIDLSFREIIEETEDLITRVDAEGNFLFVSSSSEKYYGFTPEQCLGRPAFAFIHPDDQEETKKAFTGWLKDGGSSFTFTNRQMHRDGGCHHMLWTITAIKNDDGSIKWFNSIARDVTPQILAEKELQRIQAILRDKVEERTAALKLATEVFKHSLEGVVITDKDNIIIDVNEAFTNITGHSKERVIGLSPRILKSDRHEEDFYRDMWDSLQTKGAWEGEIWNRRRSGEVYPEWLSINTITDSKGEITNYVGVFHDISESKASQEKIKHQANHDALTGLPNRILLLDRLRKAIASSARSQKGLALLFIDLDNFKNVNDSLGHLVGDEILVEAATRLNALIRESDTVARLGGDEFVIMVNDIPGPHNAVALASRIMETFSRPFITSRHRFTITPSIGITFYPEDGSTPEELIKNADMAMYQAKESGKNRFHLFTPGLTEAVRQRIDLENRLREAIKMNELTVYYQPKIRLSDGKIMGMEALARWIQHDGSMVPPGVFIPLAEDTGLIIPLGEQVLELACLQTAELNQCLGTDLKVSVNLSLQQFKQERLLRTLMDIITMTGISPANLEMEITESTVMEDIDLTRRTLDALTENGIQLSIDDFGTGFSSLSHLKHLPLHTLKIDQSFVAGLPDNEPDANIASVIISLASSFGLSTVAEGVENVEQYVHLKSLGCDIIQGYLYSPPVPAEKFTDLVKSQL